MKYCQLYGPAYLPFYPNLSCMSMGKSLDFFLVITFLELCFRLVKNTANLRWHFKNQLSPYYFSHPVAIWCIICICISTISSTSKCPPICTLYSVHQIQFSMSAVSALFTMSNMFDMPIMTTMSTIDTHWNLLLMDGLTWYHKKLQLTLISFVKELNKQ